MYMLNNENTVKTTTIEYDNQFRIFYQRTLLYNPIIKSYDKMQRVIITYLNLVQSYLNMCR